MHSAANARDRREVDQARAAPCRAPVRGQQRVLGERHPRHRAAPEPLLRHEAQAEPAPASRRASARPRCRRSAPGTSRRAAPRRTSRSSSSCWPLPETPAMPTISPECTSRWMSLRSVPNGSSDACESPASRSRTSPPSVGAPCSQHRQVLADHHPRHRLRRFLRRDAGAGHLAAAQHRRRVAELLDLVELVADVEDAAALRGELAQRLEELAHRLRRQHRRRLVHDQELRVLQQAADDLDALALADRQRVHEPARIDRAGRTSPTPSRCAAARSPRSGAPGSASATFSTTVSVSNSEKCWNTMPMPSARACAGLAGVDRLALPEHLAVGRPRHAVDDLHQRRLAGAVLAEHRVDLAGHHREIDAVVGDDRRIDLADAAQLEARRRAAGRLRGCRVPPSIRGASVVRAPRSARAVGGRRRARRAAHLQQLGGDRDGDRRRAPCRRCRRCRSGRSSSRKARARTCRAPPAAARTARRFDARADQSEVREIAAREDALGERLVERMAVRHHEEIRARRRRGDLRLGRVGRPRSRRWPARRPETRRRARRPTVTRQAMPAEHAHQRATDVAGAEQHDVEIGRAQRRRRRLESRRAGRRASRAARARRLGEQRPGEPPRPRRRSAARPACPIAVVAVTTQPACASRRSGPASTIAQSTPRAAQRGERVDPCGGVRARGSNSRLTQRRRSTGRGSRPAESGAARRGAARRRAGRARSRSPCTRDGRRRSCRRSRRRSRPSACPAARGTEPFAATTLTSTAARRARAPRCQRVEPVAHASLPPRPALATRRRARSASIALQDRLGRRRRVERRAGRGSRPRSRSRRGSRRTPRSRSSSGGSPTAFERWIVSSTLLPFSKSFTRKSAGQSLADRDLVGRRRVRHQHALARSTTAPRS